MMASFRMPHAFARCESEEIHTFVDEFYGGERAGEHVEATILLIGAALRVVDRRPPLDGFALSRSEARAVLDAHARARATLTAHDPTNAPTLVSANTGEPGDVG